MTPVHELPPNKPLHTMFNKVIGLLRKRSIYRIAAAAVCFSPLLSGWESAQASPTNIEKITYFDADIRDAEFCDVTVKDNGEVSFGQLVNNPAMTCPDAFSWYLFTKVIREEFWTRWADETQNWPSKPWPLCDSTSGKNCCDPESDDNSLAHCPFFPGKRFDRELNKAAPLLANKKGSASASREQGDVNEFLKVNEPLVRVSAPRGKGRRPAVERSEAKGVAECTDSQLISVLPENPQSIGRVLRQTNSELTVRNLAFHRYLFLNDLYNADGVLEVFKKNASNQKENSPYHQANVSATDKRTSDLYTVDLPPDAIMIKSNWVSSQLVDAIKKRYPSSMTAFGKPEAYIRHPMKTLLSIDDKKCVLADSHYLMAFHISSKDIPQWVWTTFEHVNNPGRCDYTGCNDSFGHLVERKGASATNFIVPNQKSDQLAQSSIVFDPDKQYPHGKESTALKALLKAKDIGTDKTSGAFANPRDAAWKNYRLKGSQVEFTDRQGRATHLGNSITEAGFMSQSSCIGCHARAGVALVQNAVNSKIEESANFLQLGVFEPVLSEFGYEQSHDGTPEHAWYYDDSPSFNLEVLQTDFIWGFLNANPLD